MAYESESLREIRRIREAIYEETKGMTLEERSEYHRRRSREVEETLRKDGYKLVPSEKNPGCRTLIRI
jgi:hypothetical protein